MATKTIVIPKFLREIHGETATLVNLVTVYASGVLTSAAFVFGLAGRDIPIWKLVVVALLGFDIGGGVVANLSSSTNRFYRGKPKLRAAFLMLHVVQPALFAFLFREYVWYFACSYAYTMLACALSSRARSAETQQNIASLSVVIGVLAAALFFDLTPRILCTFAPLFMLKLILGFSVRRPGFDQDTTQPPR